MVQANLNAAISPKSDGKVINIGTGNSTTIKDLVIIIARILDSNLEPICSEARDGDIKHSLADISRARNLISYEPAYTLERGLELTVDSTIP